MADTTALKNRIRAAIKANDNQEITGPVLQQALLDMVDELNGATETEANARQNADVALQQNITTEKNRAEAAESTLQQNIAAEATARQQGDTQLNNLITSIKNNIDNGYVYAGIATSSSTPATGKVFYLALTAGTYTNFGNIAVTQGINILKYNGSAWSLDVFVGIDDEPTAGSNNLVKSGGIAEIGENVKILQSQVVGVSDLYTQLLLNKYVSTLAVLSDGNGWACLRGITITNENANLVFENEDGYWEHLYIIYDKNHTFLGYHFATEPIRNDYPVANILQEYPTAKYIDVDFWNSGTTPLTDADIADWRFYQKDRIGGIQKQTDDLKNKVIADEKDLSVFKKQVLGQENITYGIALNKLVYPNGSISDGNGWACYPDYLELDENVKSINFIRNQKGYYFWFFICFDENKNVIGRFEAGNNNYKYSVPVPAVLGALPLCKYIKIDIWDGSNTTPLTDADIADWELSLSYSDSLIKDIDSLNKIIIGKSELSDLFILNKLVYPNGNISDGNGWACINDFVSLSPTLSFKLINESGYGFWVLRCFDETKTLIGSYQISEAGVIKNEFTGQQVLNYVPLCKYIKIDIWDGSTSSALVESDVANWELVVTDSNAVVESINDLKLRVVALENVIEPNNSCHIDFTSNALSYMESVFHENKILRTSFKINREISGSTHETIENSCLNFDSVKLDGVTFANTGDDIAPENMNGTYVGANHGCSDIRTVVTSSPHGKTAVDIGSQWLVGTIQVTIVGIPSENKIWILPSTNNQTYPLWSFASIPYGNGSFTHVSGATHIDSFSGTIDTGQYKPAMIKNVSRVFIDGKEIKVGGDYKFKKLVIQEQYDVLNVASLLNYIKNNVGTFTHEMLTEEDLSPVDRVTSHNCSYIFKSSYQWVWTIDFTAYQNINISYYGYIQQPYLPGSNCKLYIPRTLPITWTNPSTQEQVVTDFRTPQDHSARPVTLNITEQYWEDPNYAPDRYLEFTDSAANISGFLPDNEIGGSNRKNFINNAFFLYTSRKVYPHGIDDKLTIQAGQTFSGAVFRNYLHPSQLNNNGILSHALVNYKGNAYLYVDFTAEGKYEIIVPPEYAGMEVYVVDKSSNVQVLSKQVTGSLLVLVNAANPWSGSLICKFSK